MKFNIITLFPEFCKSIGDYSIIGRAIKNNTIKVDTINLRTFGLGKHKKVDDKPYGGGVGMLLRVDVLDKAVRSIKKLKKSKIILLSPKGEQFNQKMAEELSKFNQLIFICAHYEGFDERVRDFADKEISVGPYILTGGEIPAMIIIDAISRQIPEVLGKAKSKEIETFSRVGKSSIIEYPQYTRPRTFKGKKVPDVLVSGNHGQIDSWKKQNTRKVA